MKAKRWNLIIKKPSVRLYWKLSPMRNSLKLAVEELHISKLWILFVHSDFFLTSTLQRSETWTQTFRKIESNWATGTRANQQNSISYRRLFSGKGKLKCKFSAIFLRFSNFRCSGNTPIVNLVTIRKSWNGCTKRNLEDRVNVKRLRLRKCYRWQCQVR